eukprot:gene2217-1382_t
MAKSTQAKKEEAELRKIAKASREAKKKAKSIVKKKERSEMRRRAREGVTGDEETAKASLSAAPRRAKALILPDEVADLKKRLNLVDKEKAASSSSSSSNGLTSSSSAAGSSGGGGGGGGVAAEVPNYHSELQYKRKLVMVDVVLHHVPPQKIDVSETNASRLVVDTTKHTKKYRLVLPMPNGLRMNVEEGSFELDHGVLKCRIPVLNEEIPIALQREWDSVQQKIREQRALRFKVSQDGELKVRTRQALLPPDLKAQHQQQAMVERRKRERQAAVASDDDPDMDDEEAGEEENTLVLEKAKAKAKAKNDDEADATAASNSSKKKAKQDAFREEQERAQQIARDAAKAVRRTIAEKVKMTQEVHQRRLAKLQAKDSKKAVRDEKRQQEFERILAEQKEKVMAEMSMQAAAEKEMTERQAARQLRGKANKTVTFA